MPDVKLQVCRPVADSPDLDTVTGVSNCDFRGHGGEVGFPDAHRTFAESPNADDDFVDWLTNPERLAEVVQEGDSVGTVFNRVFRQMVERQPALLGQAASLLGLEGSGIVYSRICVMDE